VRPRKLARVLAAVIVALSCVVWLDSPLRPSATRRMQMLGIAPQWWGYFAHPLEDRMQAFRRRDGAWVQADAPLGVPGNLLGLHRGPVQHSAEFNTLRAQVGERWSTATLGPHELPETAVPLLAVRNVARHPRLCGEVLLLERTPLPWAWARSHHHVALPTRFARLDVQC
jgi:hypothetical protein